MPGGIVGTVHESSVPWRGCWTGAWRIIIPWRTETWLVTKVSDRKSPKDRVVGPLPNGLYKWPINGGGYSLLTIPGIPSSKWRFRVDFFCFLGAGCWAGKGIRGNILPIFSRWWFQTFFMFTPSWGNDPIWLYIFFQMGWFNHQLVLRVAKTLDSQWESAKTLDSQRFGRWSNDWRSSWHCCKIEPHSWWVGWSAEQLFARMRERQRQLTSTIAKSSMIWNTPGAVQQAGKLCALLFLAHHNSKLLMPNSPNWLGYHHKIRGHTGHYLWFSSVFSANCKKFDPSKYR